jgi:ketosteroid isomerase-like protein
MRLRGTIIVAALMLLTNSITTLAADPTNIPAISQSRVNADVISRADHALRDYVLACLLNDGRAIGRAVTNDAVFEFALDDPGSYLSIDATSLRAHCADEEPAAASEVRISNVWVFPTGDANSVFVRYTISAAATSQSGTAGSEHLALVEMRGDRIAKLRDFTTKFEGLSHELARR